MAIKIIKLLSFTNTGHSIRLKLCKMCTQTSLINEIQYYLKTTFKVLLQFKLKSHTFDSWNWNFVLKRNWKVIFTKHIVPLEQTLSNIYKQKQFKGFIIMHVILWMFVQLSDGCQQESYTSSQTVG